MKLPFFRYDSPVEVPAPDSDFHMRFSFKLFLILASSLLLLYLFSQLWIDSCYSSSKSGKSIRSVDISPICACADESDGTVYDFCYSLPYNDTVHGRRFSCKWLPILKSLGLLDGDQFVDIDNHKFADQGSVVFVTAASQWYFEQVLVLIDSIQKHFPSNRVIFYDLGLNASSIQVIRRLCNVEYRLFHFEDYPEWVGRLYEFRWKPLIIAVRFFLKIFPEFININFFRKR